MLSYRRLICAVSRAAYCGHVSDAAYLIHLQRIPDSFLIHFKKLTSKMYFLTELIPSYWLYMYINVFLLREKSRGRGPAAQC